MPSTGSVWSKSVLSPSDAWDCAAAICLDNDEALVVDDWLVSVWFELSVDEDVLIVLAAGDCIGADDSMSGMPVLAWA